MSLNPLFNKFYDKLLLTEKQGKDAITKHTGVCETLHNAFYTTKYSGVTRYLFGSYGKSTNIRPPRDIDIIFKMPEELFEKYSKSKNNGPSQLLQDVRSILMKTYSTTEEIKGWGKVVLIKFKDGTHNVEVLPSWEQKDDKFLIPNTENGGSWETVDLRSEKAILDECNQKYENRCTFLVRILKRWAEYCSVNIKSFTIEQYCISYLTNKGNIFQEISEEVNSFFIYLENNIDADNKSKVESARKRSKKAIEFEKSGKLDSASEEWRKIFGHEYPLHKIEALSKLYPSDKEEDFEESIGIPILINPKYEFKIEGHVSQDGFRNRTISDFILNALRLKKSKQIAFKIDKNTVPLPYEIYWKVRNYGEEAKEKLDLRGEISKDNGHLEKIENTKYKGEHFVECYCVKDNVCVAIDQIFVPIE